MKTLAVKLGCMQFGDNDAEVYRGNLKRTSRSYRQILKSRFDPSASLCAGTTMSVISLHVVISIFTSSMCDRRPRVGRKKGSIRLAAFPRPVRTRGHFPSDDAATKLLYLVLNHAATEWKRPPREWAEAKTQFAVMFNERFVNS